MYCRAESDSSCSPPVLLFIMMAPGDERQRPILNYKNNAIRHELGQEHGEDGLQGSGGLPPLFPLVFRDALRLLVLDLSHDPLNERVERDGRIALVVDDAPADPLNISLTERVELVSHDSSIRW
jgi:hypothetical protein